MGELLLLGIWVEVPYLLQKTVFVLLEVILSWDLHYQRLILVIVHSAHLYWGLGNGLVNDWVAGGRNVFA